MIKKPVRPRPVRSSTTQPWLRPAVAVALAAAIFAVDAFTLLGMAVAVLYVLVVLISATFCDRRRVVWIAVGCAALTVLAFAVSHGIDLDSTAFARCLISLAAIGITTMLVLQNKGAEQALREQASLLDVTHDAIIVRDLGDVIRFWNSGAEQLYGWSAREAIGLNPHALLQTVYPLPVHEIMRSLYAKDKWEGELTHTKRNGDVVAVSSRWSLQRDDHGEPIAVLETNNDISERQRAEKDLRRSEAHLAEAQRLSQTGSFGWNPESGQITWSAETYRIFEYEPTLKPTSEMIVSRTYPADRTSVQHLLVNAGTDRENWAMKHRLLMPDGRVKYVSVVAHVEPTGLGGFDFVGAVMDVTAARRAEDDLRQAQANLAHLNRVSTLGEMTASIAHEVSQPIAAIVASAGAGTRWLAASNIDEVQQSLARISRDGHRASDVISRIRALAMKRPPRQDRVPINETIREILALARGEAERGRAEVRTELAADLPDVAADRVQIQQVLLNLIVNGFEAMSSETISPRELVVSSSEDASGHVLVSVRDSGPGLDDEQLARVFEAFYTTKSHGIGMGLAICRTIIEAHDGRLWAARNEPRGAIFQFTLPSIDANAS
ncbi:MAG: ATP-binding protein [Hyphomicrobium sp.]|jgi:PAS domain S-box-containing protein